MSPDPSIWIPGSRLRAPRNDRTLLLGKLQPHGPVALRVVAPALAHLDEQEQVHLVLDDLGDFAPRRFADRLEGLPAFADHDLALALALHIDRLLNTDIAAPQFLPRLSLDRGMVGQFLVQPFEQLLARDLGRQLAHRRIRHLVGLIKPRTWWHAVGEPGLEI